MAQNKRIVLALACLVLAGLACQAASGQGTGQLPLGDDFSSPTWGTGTDADRSVEYADGTLRMILYKRNSFIWSNPNTLDYQNVHVEVTVINNGTDATTAFGIICNQQELEDNFYYLAVTPAGEYAIAKAVQGQKDLFLTNEDVWTASELIPRDAPSYRIGAECGNGALNLFVDGQQIASAFDADYTSGGVALFTWSGEEAEVTDVSFDDFLMMALP
jgi:hypothetical protein